MSQDLLPSAAVIPGGQPAGAMTMPPSLTAALMGQGGTMPQQSGGIPLASMVQLLSQRDSDGKTIAEKLWSSMGNWMDGYRSDGMAGGSMLDSLSGQAAGNITGGAQGL